MSNPIQPVDEATLSGSRQAGPSVQRASVQATEQARAKPAPEMVIAALQSTGGKVTLGGRVAEFSYDSDLDMVIVKVYSAALEPREVVRQIPPEDYIAFASRYRELLGVLFDEQV